MSSRGTVLAENWIDDHIVTLTQNDQKYEVDDAGNHSGAPLALVFPLLQFHTIRGGALHVLRAHFLPVCGQNRSVRLQLRTYKKRRTGPIRLHARVIRLTISCLKWSLTKDFCMALLISSSASWYISRKSLFKPASPSSCSSFSWCFKWFKMRNPSRERGKRKCSFFIWYHRGYHVPPPLLGLPTCPSPLSCSLMMDTLVWMIQLQIHRRKSAHLNLVRLFHPFFLRWDQQENRRDRIGCQKFPYNDTTSTELLDVVEHYQVSEHHVSWWQTWGDARLLRSYSFLAILKGPPVDGISFGKVYLNFSCEDLIFALFRIYLICLTVNKEILAEKKSNAEFATG